MVKYSYKDFGLAIEELREKADVSYDTIAFGIQRAQSYVYGICTRRTRNLPKYEVMEDFAKFFHVSPTYFYEYRLRKAIDYINKNRKFLDVVERAIKKHKSEKKVKDDPEEKKETA